MNRCWQEVKELTYPMCWKNLGVDSTALDSWLVSLEKRIRRRIQEEGIHADFLMLDEGCIQN